MNRQIVVGYDGSTHADEALAWAADAARREHVPLRIVHVARTFLDGYVVGDRPADLTTQLGRRVLEGGVDLLRATHPDVEVTVQLVPQDSISAVLVDASTHARLLVVGSRGRGGFAGLLLGSVSVTVAAHAHCPVVVVRGRHTDDTFDRSVVVGVDGSSTSTQAVDHAFDQASRSGRPLVAVHAWELPSLFGPVPPWLPAEVEEIRMAEKLVLAESLAGHSERYPDVHVTSVVQRGGPAQVLLAAGVDAELLVVGSRGLGGFGGLLLGSVSQAVLHHATCPVAVVHP